MEKIKVTQKQAEHIKYFERDRYYALEHKVNGTFSNSGCLDELSLDELAIALYVGYEVEEEKAREFRLDEAKLKRMVLAESAQKEVRRMDKKLDDLLLNLSNKERVRLCNKLICLESESHD